MLTINGVPAGFTSADDRLEPTSTSGTHLADHLARCLLSVCSSRITQSPQQGEPRLIIVAN